MWKREDQRVNANLGVSDPSDVKNVSLFTSHFSVGLVLLEYIKDFKR